MPNWCYWRMNITGPAKDVEELAEQVRSHIKTKCSQVEPDNHYPDGLIYEQSVDFAEIFGEPVEGPERSDINDVQYSSATPGKYSLGGSCAWVPPWGFPALLSLRMPTADIRLVFSVEDGESECAVFKNGDYTFVDLRPVDYGFRDLSPDVVPSFKAVRVECEPDSRFSSTIENALQDAGLSFSCPGYRSTRYDEERCRAWIAEHFPNVQVTLAFWPEQLDEGDYRWHLVQEIAQPLTNFDVPYMLSADWQDCLRLLERDVELTTQEFKWLAQDCAEQSLFFPAQNFYRLAHLRNALGKRIFDEECNTIWASAELGPDKYQREIEECQRWLVMTTPEIAVQNGYTRPFRPLRKEIEALLELYERLPEADDREQRVAVLTEALRRPRWCPDWPERQHANSGPSISDDEPRAQEEPTGDDESQEGTEP